MIDKKQKKMLKEYFELASLQKQMRESFYEEWEGEVSFPLNQNFKDLAQDAFVKGYLKGMLDTKK